MDKHLLRFDKKKVLTFIDFETLNLCLNFAYNLPWQCAMMRVCGDEILNHKDFLVKWKTDLRIGDKAAEITRYSPLQMEQFGRPPEEVFPTIYDWMVKADYIVAHNGLGFDLYLLIEWCKLEGRDWSMFLPKLIDTNLLAKGVKLGIPLRPADNLIEYQYKMYHKRAPRGTKTNLTALGKEYGIEHDYENLHNAIIDLQLNVKVWNKLKLQVEI